MSREHFAIESISAGEVLWRCETKRSSTREIVVGGAGTGSVSRAQALCRGHRLCVADGVLRFARLLRDNPKRKMVQDSLHNHRQKDWERGGLDLNGVFQYVQAECSRALPL